MQLGKGESLNLLGTNVILVSKFPIIVFWNYELIGGTKPLLETITFYDWLTHLPLIYGSDVKVYFQAYYAEAQTFAVKFLAAQDNATELH